jgi:hypothetical protein
LLRVVYEGDARDDYIAIALARTEDLRVRRPTHG